METTSYKNILRVALPIIASSIAQNIITVTDTAFLGRVGEVALGAAGNGGLIYQWLVLMGMGLATGGQIIIGRRNGEGNFLAIGKLFDHCLILLLLWAVVVYALFHFVIPDGLGLLIQSPAILPEALAYLDYRSWGVFFSVVNFGLMAFFIGTTRTFILMPAAIFTALVNVGLDYALIFGHWGFPEMGVKGAGLASAIAEASTAILMLGYTFFFANRQKYGLFAFKGFSRNMVGRMATVGAPVMLQYGISMLAWFIFFSIIEHLGEQELAISHIIRSIYMVMMIPLFGLSHSCNTLVSNLMGQGKDHLVSSLVKKLLLLGSLAALFFVPANLLFGEQMIGVYTENQNLINAAMPTLYLITSSIFVFTTGFILFSAVTGTGNTRMALALESITIFVYLMYTYLIVYQFGGTVEFAWTAEFVYFGGMTILSGWYLRSGKWRGKTI